MNIINQENINNLTSLWRTVGDSFQANVDQNTFSYCSIPNSAWPNRIWFNGELNQEILNTAITVIKNSVIPLSISHWSNIENRQQFIFDQSGLLKKSEQIGMSLKLKQKFEHSNRVKLKRVNEEKQAGMWAELYPQSFGYKISSEILLKTNHLIPYYLIYFGQQIIGTVITYETKNIIGIHGLGIIPEFRKQGFAEEVMAFLLNMAIDNDIHYATLQSSSMGKNIYLKMGFTEDFLMTNYGLATK